MIRRSTVALVTALWLAGCGAPPVEDLPPNSFAFAVFGDGPYRGWEQGRFRTLLRDIDDNDVDFMIHVGDAFWFPCSDASYNRVLADLNSVSIPVVYTPGDNEWADCHGEFEGGYEPLGRLAALRRILFADPTHSLGRNPIAVETQADDPIHAEFIENTRWIHKRFLFSTIHLIGSDNGGAPFAGRTAAHDDEVERRADAAMQWLDDGFAIAAGVELQGVVIAIHADPDFDNDARAPVFSLFIDRLRIRSAAFPGQVLLIHGDNHELTIDHPLAGSREASNDNFSRLETYGSPDIGWVRVVVDTVTGTLTEFEPRLMRGWGW